ncbi:MAG: hypothetical protein ACI35O_04110 [Bacillaceae bacterium]
MSNYESLLLLLKEYKEGYTRLEEDELFAKMTAFMQAETLSYEEYQYLLQLLSEVNTNLK